MALGEHSYQSGEAASRTDLSIPKPQMNLFKEIVKLKKPIVSLIFSGRPLILNEIKNIVMLYFNAGFQELKVVMV